MPQTNEKKPKPKMIKQKIDPVSSIEFTWYPSKKEGPFIATEKYDSKSVEDPKTSLLETRSQLIISNWWRKMLNGRMTTVALFTDCLEMLEEKRGLDRVKKTSCIDTKESPMRAFILARIRKLRCCINRVFKIVSRCSTIPEFVDVWRELKIARLPDFEKSFLLPIFFCFLTYDQKDLKREHWNVREYTEESKNFFDLFVFCLGHFTRAPTQEKGQHSISEAVSRASLCYVELAQCVQSFKLCGVMYNYKNTKDELYKFWTEKKCLEDYKKVTEDISFVCKNRCLTKGSRAHDTMKRLLESAKEKRKLLCQHMGNSVTQKIDSDMCTFPHIINIDAFSAKNRFLELYSGDVISYEIQFNTHSRPELKETYL